MAPAARYLQLVYDKQLSANDKVAEYIRLRKEEMGLTSKYNIDNDGKTVADVLGDKYTQMAGVSGSSIKEMVGVLEPTWRILPAWVSKQFFVSDLSTKGGFSSGQWLSPTEKIDIYKGVKAISGNQALSETMQYIAGVDNPVIDEFVSKYMGQYYSSPLSEWDSISSRVAAGIESFENNVNTKYNDLSFEGFGQLPADQLITVPKVLETARIKLLDIFDEQSVSSLSLALYGYKNFLFKVGEHELEDELQIFAIQGFGSFAGSLHPNGTPFEQLLLDNGYDA